MAHITVARVSDRLKAALDKAGIKLKENLTPESVEKAIIEYISENNILHLATSRNNIPRCTPLEYKHKGLNLYVFSEGGAKIAFIRENPDVAVSIASPYEPRKNFFGARGLQIWGQAKIYARFKEKEMFKATVGELGIDETRFPSHINFKVIVIEPEKIKYRDTRNGYRGVAWFKD